MGGNGDSKTMAMLVEVMEADGMYVCGHDEGDGRDYGQLPCIVFE